MAPCSHPTSIPARRARSRNCRRAGPWHKVDRIWTMRTDGSHITKIHTRTMAMEIFGHEFWNADGRILFYDLQTPRGEDFWLAGYNVETGERTQYHLQRNEWSIH